MQTLTNKITVYKQDWRSSNPIPAKPVLSATVGVD